MKNTLSQLSYGLGFGSIIFSILAYSSWGIDEATYVGLWVPSFFLVGMFFDRQD